MTILRGFRGFQHINNPCGYAATWISIPCLHGDSRLKELASTLSLKHWGGPPGLSRAKILSPFGARRTPAAVSSPGVLQTHPQTKKKAKISLKKSFLLASHTHSPEAGAEKAGCPGFPPPCPRCSSVSLLFPQADPAVAPAAEQPETSQPSATLSHLLPANVVHELPLPICALALGPGSSPSPSLQHHNHS